MEPRSLDDDLRKLHDAEWHLVVMDRETNSLRIGFTGEDKINIELMFTNVTTFKINNILYQNIVSRAMSSDGILDLKKIKEITRWTCSGSNNDLLISEENFDSILKKIYSKDLILFYIDPSWGAEAGVIAGTITISKSN